MTTQCFAAAATTSKGGQTAEAEKNGNINLDHLPF